MTLCKNILEYSYIPLFPKDANGAGYVTAPKTFLSLYSPERTRTSKKVCRRAKLLALM